MATDRSYRQLKNFQDEDFSDEESNAFAPLAGQHGQSSSGGTSPKYRPKRSQSTSGGRSCGQGRATCIIFMVLAFVLGIAVVSSFARPRCSRESGATTNIYTTEPQHTSNKPTATPTTYPWPWSNIRLPVDVKPIAYDIFLHPNLTTYNVNGNVDIQTEVLSPTYLIVLHAKNMNITDVTLTDNSTGQFIPHQKHLYNKNLEQLDITLNDELQKGIIVVSINFTYELKDGLQGFYRSTYTAEDGVKKTIATTQFEASDARAAFPCFDEPNFKATFALKMVRDPQYHTLFNMPLAYTDTYGGNLKVDVFNKSMTMSTYLVAFVVSEFESRTSPVRNNLEIGVHAPAREIDEMDLALKILNKTIQYYEEYFGVPYPLPKQDMVAIPDFSAGAMENWGLITYRQVEVLYKLGSTTIRQKQRISLVITHELAHQWFGNLVTMKWWNDLWLNEGFASYVEYIGTQHWEKEWQMMDQFILQTTQTAMALDCLMSSHPISVNVEEPDEISAVFDAISYDKGASIIRMLNNYLGEKVFVSGLTSYLKEHAYGNADSDDLWNALSNAAGGRDVKKMMDTWTIQKGYPVVNMSRNNDQIEVSQQQFILMLDFVPDVKNLWIIPLSYITDSGKNYTSLIENEEKASSQPIESSAKWFKGNIGETGFYRVNYDKDNWLALSNQLKTDYTVLAPADRASLIDDAHYLARARLLDYNVALDLTSYIIQDDDYVPIVTALSSFGYIGMMLQKSGDYILYKKYMWQLTEVWKSKLGWDEKETDSHLMKFLRDSVLTNAVHLSHEGTIQEAMSLFRNWKDNNVSLNVNLKYPVYCAAAQNGVEADWEFLWNRYLTMQVVSEKNLVMQALGCTKDLSIIYRYLDSVFDQKVVRLQDIGHVIASVASHPQGAQPAWLFLQQNWGKLLEMMGSTSFSFGSIITSCTRSIASSVEHGQAKSFFDVHSNAGSASRAVQHALEGMEINVNWLRENQVTIRKWLTSVLN